MAQKFVDHFLRIAHAVNQMGPICGTKKMGSTMMCCVFPTVARAGSRFARWWACCHFVQPPSSNRGSAIESHE